MFRAARCGTMSPAGSGDRGREVESARATPPRHETADRRRRAVRDAQGGQEGVGDPLAGRGRRFKRDFTDTRDAAAGLAWSPSASAAVGKCCSFADRDGVESVWPAGRDDANGSGTRPSKRRRRRHRTTPARASRGCPRLAACGLAPLAAYGRPRLAALGQMREPHRTRRLKGEDADQKAVQDRLHGGGTFIQSHSHVTRNACRNQDR